MSFVAVLERLAKLENPYPGLRPFETSEAHLFFGRDQQVLDLLDRLARNRFVAVIGLSGSGKSSLVRAGLIPALNRGRLLETGLQWRVALARPAGAPFDTIADSIGCKSMNLRASSHGLIDYAREQLSQGEGLLVVIDQFEELFRYKDLAVASAGDRTGHAAAASEAAAFIRLLLESTRSPLPIYVVITMRTEYLGDCAEFPEFPELLNESLYLVPRLTRQQRHQAIEGPLGRVRISSALVEHILNDAGDEPDQLSILQHALMRTWSRWRGLSAQGERPIETEDYEAIGGFEDALNQHADELLHTPAVRADPKFVEIIFKRLTALGRDNREHRDPAPLSELWDLCNAVSEERRLRVNAIIDVFRQGEATFLTPRKGELRPNTYIDIAHERLIPSWKVLAEQWLPEEEKQAKHLVELWDRARGWRAGKREVLIGLDLSGALEWNIQRNRSAKWAEHYVGAGAIEEVEAFISASHEEFDQSERRARERREVEFAREAAELRAQAERASARRTRIFSYVLAVLLLASLGLSLIAWSATLGAESRELATKAESLVSLGKRGEALDIAIHAFSIKNTSQAREVIARAFPQELMKLGGDSGRVFTASFSPDGQRVVTAGEDRTARVWDAATGQVIAKLEGHTGAVTSAVFSPDGQRVVTAGEDRTARVWNAATGQVIAKLEGHTGAVTSAVFSPDGQRVLTASVDGTARVWNAATGQVIAKLEGHTGPVTGASFSPDGQRVVTGSYDRTARVWDAATGQVIAKLKGHTGPVTGASFSPDGQRVVTASYDRTARVWNAATGQVIAKLEGHTGGVTSAVFSPDGQRVLTASVDETARVWNAATGQVIAKLEGHTGPVTGGSFSPDGQRVVTWSYDGTARAWNAATGQVIAKLEGHTGVITSASFSPDGLRVVTASYDSTARVWNATAGQVIAKLEGHTGPMTRAAFSPDGQRVVTASNDGTARVWNAATGQVIAKLEGHTGPMTRASFSPDGQRVVTASNDGMARVWNAATGQVIAKLEGHTDVITSASFSPDGQRVVTASADQTARVWNAATGQVITELEGHAGAIYAAAFSPDGQRVVTAGEDRTARVWNAVAGQVIVRLEGHTDVITTAAFSPEGQRVVTASADQTARVWNAATGQVITKLEGHIGLVYTAEFSPEGHRVVTAGADQTARVWNAATGQVIAKLEGHTGAVTSAAFSPDGKRVITASYDGTARIFRIITLNDIACLLASK